MFTDHIPRSLTCKRCIAKRVTVHSVQSNMLRNAHKREPAFPDRFPFVHIFNIFWHKTFSLSLNTPCNNSLFQLILEERKKDDNGQGCGNNGCVADQVTAVVRIC